MDLEANAVVDIYRLADGMLEPQRTQLQKLAQFLRGRGNHSGVTADGRKCGARTNLGSQPRDVEDGDVAEGGITDGGQRSRERLSELSLRVQHGQTRTRQSTARLPRLLWCVLLEGGALTVVSACSFGAESVKLQALNVFIISVLVSLSLVAIADLYRPFHGLIHVKDDAFRRAQQSIQPR